MFYISGENPDGVLKFTCKHLGEDNKCTRYFFRPLKCWTYPDHHVIDKDHIMKGKQTKEGCGFSYKSTVTFDEVLDFCRD
jgi:Fe-S-cluster containining protein